MPSLYVVSFNLSYGGGEGLVGGEAFDDGCNEVVDSGLVVGIDRGCDTVGNDGADCHGTVSHELGEALQSSALHLVVGDVSAIVFKLLDATVEFGFSEW